MGRRRKPLEEKSTSIIIKLDNKTIIKLCEKLNIDINTSGEMIEESTIRQINGKIIEILKKFVK